MCGEEGEEVGRREVRVAERQRDGAEAGEGRTEQERAPPKPQSSCRPRP